MRKIILLTVLLVIFPVAFSLDSDERLQYILQIYGVTPESCENSLQSFDKGLVEVGEVIFDSKEFSGGKDTSCSTCHLRDRNLIDGLPTAIGVGGHGEGLERLSSLGVIVPRNVFTLIGRASADYKTYFWDGRVQKLPDGTIISPFGENLDENFHSLLAVAAVQPFLARDEFLGLLDGADENEHLSVNKRYHNERYDTASIIFRDKVMKGETEELRRIGDLFEKAGRAISEIRLSDFGNALAAFFASEFSCQDSAWNQYVQGNANALTEKQKVGASHFFGKARCAVCHTPPLFSDFDFHSIASHQGGVGFGVLSQDLGRGDVTFRPADRYKFRTPPLLDVANTAPYGHSGQFPDLKSVILHHINPILYFQNNNWVTERELLQYGKILGQRDEILTFYDLDNLEEVDELIEFLGALTAIRSDDSK